MQNYESTNVSQDVFSLSLFPDGACFDSTLLLFTIDHVVVASVFRFTFIKRHATYMLELHFSWFFTKA